MSMPAAWMPGAVRRPILYRRLAGKFTSVPLGWILHVVVGNGSPYRGFVLALIGRRRFSHFWVSKTGVIEQYAETWCLSWAQAGGNPYYWAVETEGYPTEPLTAAQIASLAKIHNFLGTVDALANHPGERGIGTHYMGGLAWGGHSCPDPVGHEGQGPRSKQRASIIAASRPVTPPPPPPPPIQTAMEDDMQVLVREEGTGTPVFISNYVTRRHVGTEAEELQLLHCLAASGANAWVAQVHIVPAGTIDYYGIDITPTGA